MPTGNLRYWETGYVKCVSTTVPTKITILRGGESITLKSHESSGASHKISGNKALVSSQGFMLDSKENMTITLPVEFGRKNYIEIWALPENANKYISFFKVLGVHPSTEAGD